MKNLINKMLLAWLMWAFSIYAAIAYPDPVVWAVFFAAGCICAQIAQKEEAP